MSARQHGCLSAAAWVLGVWMLVAALIASSYPLLVVGAVVVCLANIALGVALWRQA